MSVKTLSKKLNAQNETILVLDNLRSAQNVGSIFRTADACGVARIILIGTTPCPIDRFNRPRQDITKTALGAEKTIPWEYAKTISPILKKIPYVIALEQNSKSVDYKKLSRAKIKGSVAIIIGNEPKGIPPKTLAFADCIAEIPMRGIKESLNVSVATGIFLARFLGL